MNSSKNITVLAFGVASLDHPSFNLVVLEQGQLVRYTYTHQGQDKVTIAPCGEHEVETCVIDHTSEIASGLDCPTLLDCGCLLGHDKTLELYVKLLPKFACGKQTYRIMQTFKGADPMRQVNYQARQTIDEKARMTVVQARELVPFLVEPAIQHAEKLLVATAFQQAGKRLMFGNAVDFRLVVQVIATFCPESELVDRIPMLSARPVSDERRKLVADMHALLGDRFKKLGGYAWYQDRPVYPYSIDFVVAKGNQVFAIKALPDPGYTAEDFLQLCQTQRFVGCVCFAGDERLYDAKSYLEKHKKVELDPESKISTRKVERSPYELRCMISYLMEHSIERKHRVICGGFQNDPGYDPACFIQYEDGTQVAMNVRINEPLNEGKRKEWVETTARIPQITFWVDVVPDNPKEKRLYRGSKIHISEHPRG